KEREMTVRAALPLMILLIVANSPLVGQDKKTQEKELGKHAGFEQFKLLAGEWVGKEKSNDGPDVHIQYKVTGAGSAVVETIFPGTEHEMVSVIHPDGS